VFYCLGPEIPLGLLNPQAFAIGLKKLFSKLQWNSKLFRAHRCDQVVKNVCYVLFSRSVAFGSVRSKKLMELPCGSQKVTYSSARIVNFTKRCFTSQNATGAPQKSGRCCEQRVSVRFAVRLLLRRGACGAGVEFWVAGAGASCLAIEPLQEHVVRDTDHPDGEEDDEQGHCTKVKKQIGRPRKIAGVN
jgi:hypothetical protein